MSARASSQTLSLRGAANTESISALSACMSATCWMTPSSLACTRTETPSTIGMCRLPRLSALDSVGRLGNVVRPGGLDKILVPRSHRCRTPDRRTETAWSRDRWADPLRPRSGAAASYAVHSRDLARRSPLCLASLVPGALPRPFAPRATAVSGAPPASGAPLVRAPPGVTLAEQSGVPTGRAMATRAAHRLAQNLDAVKVCALDALHDKLGNPVAA